MKFYKILQAITSLFVALAFLAIPTGLVLQIAIGVGGKISLIGLVVFSFGMILFGITKEAMKILKEEEDK
jgi:hypothetical protein